MNPQEYEITNGYIGSFGRTFKTATVETLNAAIAQAAQRHNITPAEVELRLSDGQPVEWCDSPNYTYDHSHGVIRRKRAPHSPQQLIRCSCGHSVPASQVMNTSMGTSCPDCYDKMSD